MDRSKHVELGSTVVGRVMVVAERSGRKDGTERGDSVVKLDEEALIGDENEWE